MNLLHVIYLWIILCGLAYAVSIYGLKRRFVENKTLDELKINGNIKRIAIIRKSQWFSRTVSTGIKLLMGLVALAAVFYNSKTLDFVSNLVTIIGLFISLVSMLIAAIYELYLENKVEQSLLDEGLNK